MEVVALSLFHYRFTANVSSVQYTKAAVCKAAQLDSRERDSGNGGSRPVEASVTEIEWRSRRRVREFDEVVRDKADADLPQTVSHTSWSISHGQELSSSQHVYFLSFLAG